MTSDGERSANWLGRFGGGHPRLVAVLWAYFDESGLHDFETGKLEWLVLGGGMSTADNWLLLSEEWTLALDDFGVDVFHMADFEKYHGEFRGWNIEDHDALLNRLLDIQARYVPEIFGVTNHGSRHIGRFRKLYEKNIADVMKMAAHNIAPNHDEPLSLMFAVHKDYASSNIEKCFNDLVGNDPRFAECTVGKPPDHPPLQVADMIAYELSHSIIDGRSARDPYLHMKERAKNLTLWLVIS